MANNYHTTGNYSPSASYWTDNRTFKINFDSYTPGGSIVLVASGFQTSEGMIMSSDASFVFPN